MKSPFVAMLAIVGALTGFFISIALPHRYLAHASLRVRRAVNLTQENYDDDAKRMAEAAAKQVLSDAVLAALIAREARLRELVMVDPDLAEHIREGSRIYPTPLPGGAHGISIDFEAEEAEPAIDINRALTNLAAKAATGAAQYADKREATEIAEPPRVEPTGATVPLCITLGSAAGLLGGLALALLARDVATAT